MKRAVLHHHASLDGKISQHVYDRGHLMSYNLDPQQESLTYLTPKPLSFPAV